MNRLPANIPDCTIFLLAKAYQKAHALFKQRLKNYGLTNMQHLVLEALWYQDGYTAAELCKFLILDKATLSGVLDRMVDAGWVKKRQDEKDRRVLRIYTTSKSNDLKEALIRVRTEANEELLSGFTAEEQILFKRLLRDMI